MQAMLLFLLLFTLQASRPASQPSSTQDQPTPVILTDLKPPSLKRDGVEAPPEDGVIARNAGVAGRFTEEGTTVDYSFESRAGEVSLFQLASWGYARGWQSTARIRVLDEAGFELASRTRAGGTRCELFLAFEAPRDGVYHCELRATKEFYRYTLLRHSNFPASHGAQVDLGMVPRSYAFLSDSAARVVFSLQLKAGQETSFTAVNADPRARRAISAARAAVALAGGNAPLATEQVHDWPTLAVRVLGQTETHKAISHHCSFTPTTTGTYLVEVFSQSQGEGGIFELKVDHGVVRHPVRGRIAGHSTEARAGVELRFFREPSFELRATTRTNEQGDYQTLVPSGSYTVTLQSEGRGPTSFRTKILGPRELNAIYSEAPIEAPTSRPTNR